MVNKYFYFFSFKLSNPNPYWMIKVIFSDMMCKNHQKFNFRQIAQFYKHKVQLNFFTCCYIFKTTMVQAFRKLRLMSGNILLHDYFEGCIEIANPKGVIFSSQGAKPRGMNNWLPRDWQFQCIPRNNRAIVFLHSLLNRQLI